jgi:hypothetical protein
MLNLSQPNLTQHPPRSVRVRLGGYAHLPRLLDKARAVIAGQGGEFHYNCPLDKHFFAFTGIDPKKMFTAVKVAKSDSAMLAWVNKHTRRQPHEIVAWSAWLEQHGPGGKDGHRWIADTVEQSAAGRTDIRSFADLLDLDDYVSYGGKG